VLALAALVMRRLVASPFGPVAALDPRERRQGESLGVSVRRYRLAAFVVAAVFGAVGGALLVVPTASPTRCSPTGRTPANLVFMLLLGASTISSGRCSAPSCSSCCKIR